MHILALVLDAPNLKKAMDLAGMSNSQLADELGVSKQYVADMTHGRRSLSRNPALRKQIAKVLNVPVHWIEVQPEAVAG